MTRGARRECAREAFILRRRESATPSPDAPARPPVRHRHRLLQGFSASHGARVSDGPRTPAPRAAHPTEARLAQGGVPVEMRALDTYRA